MKILKVINYALKIFRSILFYPLWILELLLPRDKNIFVFSTLYSQRYTGNTRALFEYILKFDSTKIIYWVTENNSLYNNLLNNNIPVVKKYSIKSWFIHLQAGYAFDTHVGDLNNYALNGAKRIRLWHGMPLKKIGNDDLLNINKNFIIRYLKNINYSYIKNADFTISSSEFFIPFLSSAFLLNSNNILLTGIPRTDYFYINKIENIIIKIRNQFLNSKIILFMPTFRFSGSGGSVYNPFEGFHFNKEKFSEFLKEENIVFLYKPHFNDRKLSFELSLDRFILLNDNDYDELYILLSNIDILITDYSSVYFDFLCLRKPIILNPFDYEDYIKNVRELYFNYNELKSIKAYNWDELFNIVKEYRYYPPSDDEIEKFSKYNDGNASKRCFSKIMELIK